MRRLALALVLALIAFPVASAPPTPAATPAEARAFVEGAEAKLLALSVEAERATWVQENFITDDTETIAALAAERRAAAAAGMAKQATRFDGLALPADVARKLELLKLSLVLAAPANPAAKA